MISNETLPCKLLVSKRFGVNMNGRREKGGGGEEERERRGRNRPSFCYAIVFASPSEGGGGAFDLSSKGASSVSYSNRLSLLVSSRFMARATHEQLDVIVR